MKRIALSFALAVLLSGAQAALLHRIGGGAMPMALPLVVVVWLAVEAPLVEGCWAALAVGYAIDVLGGGPRGLLAFLTVILYLSSRLARAELAIHGRLGFALVAGVGTFLVGATYFLLARATAPPGVLASPWLLWRALVEALSTGIAALLLHPLLGRLERLFSRAEAPDVLRS